MNGNTERKHLFRAIAEEYICDRCRMCVTCVFPRTILIAGQPGAGHSQLARVVKETDSLSGVFFHIEPAVVRALIPNSGNSHLDTTQTDQSMMLNELREAAWESSHHDRPYTIEECVWDNPDAALKFVQYAQEKGQSVSLHALSVPKEVSRIALFERYEVQLAAKDFDNAYYPDVCYHDISFEAFREAVRQLQDTVDDTHVHNRKGNYLYKEHLVNPWLEKRHPKNLRPIEPY